MCRTCTRPNYIDTYSRYSVLTSKAVDAELRTHLQELQGTCFRVRLATLAHLVAALDSQTRFERVPADTRARIHRMHRLAQLGQRAHLRRLQARVLRHVWRPSSRLVAKEARRALDMFTTPSA